MDLEHFSKEVEAAGQRMTILHRHARSRNNPTKKIMIETLEELQITMEELRVSEEELRQQNEELAAISERLAAEQMRYQDLFDFAPEGYLVTDMHGIVLEANQKALHQLNLPLKFLQGKTLINFVPTEHRRSFRLLLNTLQTSGDEAPAQEWKGLFKPRALPHFEASLLTAPVRDPRSGQMALRWMVRDITESRKTERLLAAQTAALTHSLSALTAEPALPGFLEETLSALNRQFHCESLELWLRQAGEETPTRTLCYPASTAPTDSASLTAHPAWWQMLLQTRQTFVTALGLADRREASSPSPQEALLIVPLIVSEQVMGGLSLRCLDRASFNAAEIAFAQALAQQMALAVHLTRLTEQAQENAILHERNRMARELHDVMAQSFVGIALQMEGAADALVRAPAQVGGHITRSREIAAQGLAEARRSVRALRPQILEQHPLPEALEQWLRSVQTETGPELHFELHGTPYRLLQADDALLRIGQEAITNALRHADASHITLKLDYGTKKVSLSVSDNGNGFQKTDRGQGFGLLGIEERAAQIHACCDIRSHPGKGTEIRVVTPVSKAAGRGSLEIVP